MNKLVYKITHDEPELKGDFEAVSEEGRDLLLKMLTKDPSERPSASECLKHKWFTTFDIAVDAEQRISGVSSTENNNNSSNLLVRQKSSVLNRASSNLMNHQEKKKEGT